MDPGASRIEFSSQNFDSVKYVQWMSNGKTYEKLKEDHTTIKELSKKNAQDLQNNVYKNYPKYINASNDITKLESDVHSLKHLLREQEAACRELRLIASSSSADVDKAIDLRGEIDPSRAKSPFDELKSPISSSIPGSPVPWAEASQLKMSASYQEWLLDVPGDLDVFIAQRAFVEAVDLAVRAKNELEQTTASSRIPELKATIEGRIQFLSSTLSQELQRPALQLHTINSIVSMLMQLGQVEEARRMFLVNRSHAIKRELRKLKMEGSTDLFIHKHATVFFGIVRSTCIEFEVLFDDMAKSAFISWVMAELRQFAEIFDRQVFQPTTTYETVANCIDVANQQCRQLADIGLDLEVMMWDLLENQTVEAIEDQGRYWCMVIASQLEDETWQPQEFSGKHARKLFLERMVACEVEDPDQYIENMSTVLCEATSLLLEQTYSFVTNSVRLYNSKVGSCIIQFIEQLLPVFLEKLIAAADSSDLFSTNANFVLLIGAMVRSKMENVMGSICPRLRAVEAKLKKQWDDNAKDSSIV